MTDPRSAAVDRAADRAAARRFRHAVPNLSVTAFGVDRLYSCEALGVTVEGPRCTDEGRFLRAVRAAAAGVDPTTAPADAVATAMAVGRATDEDLRSWIEDLRAC